MRTLTLSSNIWKLTVTLFFLGKAEAGAKVTKRAKQTTRAAFMLNFFGESNDDWRQQRICFVFYSKTETKTYLILEDNMRISLVNIWFHFE